MPAAWGLCGWDVVVLVNSFTEENYCGRLGWELVQGVSAFNDIFIDFFQSKPAIMFNYNISVTSRLFLHDCYKETFNYFEVQKFCGV